jgi:hypothetical protein
MNNRKHKHKKGKHPRGKGSKLIAPFQGNRPGSYRTAIEPTERDITLIYPFDFTLGGSATVSRRFTPNSAYDVDPTAGSTSTPGFAEYANLYGYYRVVRVSYKIEISNTDALPVHAYTYFTNADPGTSMPYTVVGNPLAKGKLLSAGGGGRDTIVLQDSQTVATILGSNTVEWDDQYRSLTNASPADLVWLTVGVHQPGGTSITAASVNVVVVIRMLIRFYDRISALVSFQRTEVLKQKAADKEKELASLKAALQEKEDLIRVLCSPKSFVVSSVEEVQS